MWLVAVSVIVGYSPTAWAQFTHTQLTSSNGGDNFEPSINADGTRIAFRSSRDLIPGSNADGNFEIFLATGSRVDLTVSGSGP